jgi:hypothetical protein
MAKQYVAFLELIDDSQLSCLVVRLCLILTFAVSSTGAWAQQKLSVLFVGNSLTFSNNLPEIVKKVAACDSVQLYYETIALPNYALVDHLAEGKVQERLASRHFDFVIVQQGPSSQSEGKQMLVDAGLTLSGVCRKTKTRLVFYMVWPFKSRMQDFPGVYKNYKLAADTTHSIFSPAGEAWVEAWKRSPALALYSFDNFHPSYDGSLLAAMVIYGSIASKKELSFIGYKRFKTENVLPANFNVMLQAAETVLLRTVQ